MKKECVMAFGAIAAAVSAIIFLSRVILMFSAAMLLVNYHSERNVDNDDA